MKKFKIVNANLYNYLSENPIYARIRKTQFRDEVVNKLKAGEETGLIPTTVNLPQNFNLYWAALEDSDWELIALLYKHPLCNTVYLAEIVNNMISDFVVRHRPDLIIWDEVLARFQTQLEENPSTRLDTRNWLKTAKRIAKTSQDHGNRLAVLTGCLGNASIKAELMRKNWPLVVAQAILSYPTPKSYHVEVLRTIAGRSSNDHYNLILLHVPEKELIKRGRALIRHTVIKGQAEKFKVTLSRVKAVNPSFNIVPHQKDLIIQALFTGKPAVVLAVQEATGAKYQTYLNDALSTVRGLYKKNIEIVIKALEDKSTLHSQVIPEMDVLLELQ